MNLSQTKKLDKSVAVCGNCKHFMACGLLYYVGPKTKKCQLIPSKFESRWVNDKGEVREEKKTA